jgi:hypothetical protein
MRNFEHDLHGHQAAVQAAIEGEDTWYWPGRPPPGARLELHPPVGELRRRRGSLTADQLLVLQRAEHALAEAVADSRTRDALAAVPLEAWRQDDGSVGVGFSPTLLGDPVAKQGGGGDGPRAAAVRRRGRGRRRG